VSLPRRRHAATVTRYEAPVTGYEWSVESTMGRRREEGVMAVYEFICKKCGRTFEVTCRIDEREANAVCPKCGSRKVDQKLTASFGSPRPAKW
jgi:putative FmdB family regulatory protein